MRDKFRIAFLAGWVLGYLLLVPLPAKGHTQEAQTEWLNEFVQTVFTDNWLTTSEAQMLLEFKQRHKPPIRLEPQWSPPRSQQVWSPGVEQWRSLVQTHFTRNPEVDVTWAMRVMWCESRGDPNAYNVSSGASGLFQHLQRFWADRSAKAGIPGADIFDPEANIHVAAWLYYNGGPQHWVCK